MELNRLDVLVLLKIQALEARPWTQSTQADDSNRVNLMSPTPRTTRPWTQSSLADELCIAQSQVHASLKRAQAARLFSSTSNRVSRQALAEFLIHGVKYAFPPIHGGLTRGMETSYAAPPLRDLIVQPDTLPPVWPHPNGPVRGYEFGPLHKRAPNAALKDAELYELLVLVDAIRDGRPREAILAVGILTERMEQNP